MKKTILSLLAFCCTLLLSAEPIGKQAALYTAQSYMLAKGKSLSAEPSPRRGVKSSQEGEDYYYVFNAGNDGGYVIVSGDDRTEPILGYVDHGTFDPDNIPENMRSWLQLYADQIKYVIDNNLDPSSPQLKKRNKVQSTKHSIPTLMPTRWNQGHPYNLTCPHYYTDKDNDEHAYPASGCAATAMAQVFNHYKYPAKTKGVIPAHSNTYTLANGTKKTVSMPAIPRNTPIDWENMRDIYHCNDEHVHDIQDTAVANLMLYCGQALKMGYGPSSGAVTGRSRDAFVNYFGFDASAYWGGRGSYTIDEWFEMLYHEIEQGYPVLYAGHSSGGGHAFVLDGFDGDNLFHVNWGWGGGSDGWFLVSILNPGDTSGIGASSSSDGYSMSQGALFSLRIPGSPKEEGSLCISDVTLTATSVKASYTNKTGTTGSFHAGLVMEDENGELTLVGNKLTISSLASGSTATKTLLLKGKLPEGTYRLSPAYKGTKSEIWHPAYDFQSQYIEAAIDSEGNVLDIHFLKPVPTKEDISIDTITFPGTRIVGTEQEIKVKFRNDGTEYFKTVYLFAGKTQTKTYTDSKSMVAVRAGETVEVSYFFKPDETGTYNLWLCTDDKGNNVMGQGTMEVITDADATKAKLSISSYTIANASGESAYGKRLMGKASIKNVGTEDYHGGVKIQIWSQKIGDGTAWSGSTHSYNVDILAGQVANVDIDFGNLNVGYYYRFKAMYTSQEGTLSGGGIWDHKWEMKEGILTWKNEGTIVGKAYSTSLSTATNICGVYADCSKKINRMTPNSKNPNAIYAFADGMEVPAKLDTSNVVRGNHADRIKLKNDYAFYLPTSFDADSASFTYTFPETELGMGWHTFTMPFDVDSVFVDEQPVSLDDPNNLFWIYEFAAQTANGKLIFAPATKLRGGTPYIIAADPVMAGRSVVFRSLGVSFYETGSNKMVVTTPEYKFHGITIGPKLKECYILNDDGTAFEYTTTDKVVPALTSYFTTTLPEEQRLPSIVLPLIPMSEDPTGIEANSKFNTQEGDWYDLSGRKLSTLNSQLSTLRKGIYIVNGKKVLK